MELGAPGVSNTGEGSLYRRELLFDAGPAGGSLHDRHELGSVDTWEKEGGLAGDGGIGTDTSKNCDSAVISRRGSAGGQVHFQVVECVSVFSLYSCSQLG